VNLEKQNKHVTVKYRKTCLFGNFVFKNNVIYKIFQTAPTSSLEPRETLLMGVSLPDGLNGCQEL